MNIKEMVFGLGLAAMAITAIACGNDGAVFLSFLVLILYIIFLGGMHG